VKKNVESVDCKIPDSFWKEMVNNGLIDKNYPHL
jgi:hypothetical protein